MAITPLPTPPSRSEPLDFSAKADAFIAALPTFITEANAQAAALELNSTTSNSTTSIAIGAGSKSLTVDLAKSYQLGMSVKIARTSSPSNWMHGDVISYNSGSGALVVNVTLVSGSGTYTDWTVTFSAPASAPLATAAEVLAGTEAGKVISPLTLAPVKVPTGAIMAWPNGTVPSGYLECNGASLDRTTYADLFAVLSDDYGNVDGTHFNLPDLRGRFLRGWAHGQATDPDRASRTDRGDGITGDYVGTKQAYAFKSHSHVQNTPDGPGGTFTLQGSGAAGNRSDVSTQATGDSETRPININVMWIIKY